MDFLKLDNILKKPIVLAMGYPIPHIYMQKTYFLAKNNLVILFEYKKEKKYISKKKSKLKL